MSSDAELEVARLRAILAEIQQTVRTPTPQGMKAYTHFMRDFDKIRALTTAALNPPAFVKAMRT